MPHKDITHRGTVVALSRNRVIIAIDNNGGCAGCSISAFCRIDGDKIEVKTNNAQNYVIGDKVKLSIAEKSQVNALWWGIVFPCMLLIASIVGCVAFGISETMAIIVGLLVCGAYYGIMYLMRKSIDKTMQWSIDKIG